jgi:hypothetical protein
MLGNPVNHDNHQKNIPQCPEKLSSSLTKAIYDLGCKWAKSNDRPRIDTTISEQWNKLLADWQDNENLPLFIRKSSHARGSVVPHKKTGRKIVITDNSPAQWACSLALKGSAPNIDKISNWIEKDEIPIAFAHKKNEITKREKHCTLGKHTVNKAGWKLCHIQAVGLNVSTPIEDIDVETLKKQFALLLMPSNYFLIPKQWGGMGEVDEFIRGFVYATNSHS